MKSDRRVEGLGRLLRAFDHQHTFYVIGAGASAGIIPMTSQLRSSIVERYLSFGSFPLEIQDHDYVFQRIVGDPAITDAPNEYSMLMRLNSPAVHAMVAQELTPACFSRSIPQYEIFRSVKKPGTFFSLNVDGLLAQYCRGHVLLEPHGRIPVKVVRSPMWDEIIDALLMYGFKSPTIPGLLLPQPEPRTITSGDAYRKAIRLMPSAKFVVLIGYSFGLFQDLIDDFETFEFICELMKFYHKDIIVVDPRPDFISNSIEVATNCRPPTGLKVRWNHLARAIEEFKEKFPGTEFSSLAGSARKILYRHDELADVE